MSLLLKLISVAEQSESEESVSALRSIVGAIRRENANLYQRIKGPPHSRGLFARLSPQWIQDVIREPENESQSDAQVEPVITQQSIEDNHRHTVETEHFPTSNCSK